MPILISESVLKRLFWPTAWAIAGSQAITAAVCLAFGVEQVGLTLAVAFLCPLLISPPISYFFGLQKDKLAEAMSELSLTHAELAEAYERLDIQSKRDGLTGLLNRSAFFSLAEAELHKSHDGALLIVDADHFKAINDRHGHSTGDVALSEIAAALVEGAGSAGHAGRIGGEEFAVLLPEVSPSTAAAVAQAVLAGVARSKVQDRDGSFVRLSVSIGIAMFAEHRSLDDLFNEADRRLYRAKEAGRNRIEGVPVRSFAA